MSKYQVRQRYPNFITGFPATVVDFDTLDELNEVPFIKRWVSEPTFVKLSLSGTLLMAEKSDHTFWAVAYLKNLQGEPSDLSDLGLPVWVKSI